MAALAQPSDENVSENAPQPTAYRQLNDSVPQAEAAWQWFRGMGSPKYWVAPMVDQVRLQAPVPTRQLSRHTSLFHIQPPLEGVPLCVRQV